MKNIKVNIKSLFFLLWHNTETKNVIIKKKNPEIYIIESEKAQVEFSKITKKKVILFKYIIPLFLAYILVNFNYFYPSMVGLCIGIIALYIIKLVNKYAGLYGILILCAAYVSSFLLLLMYMHEFVFEYHIYYIFNYSIQYSAVLLLVDTIIKEIFEKRYENYYRKIDSKIYYIEEVKKVSSKIIKIHRIIRNSLWGTIFTIVLFMSVADILHMNKESKVVNDYKVKTINGYDYRMYDILSKKAEQLKMKKLHKNIKGIVTYEMITLTSGTSYECKDIKSKEVKKYRVPIKDKYLDKKAFIKNSLWFFYKEDKNNNISHICKITSAKAR